MNPIRHIFRTNFATVWLVLALGGLATACVPSTDSASSNDDETKITLPGISTSETTAATATTVETTATTETTIEDSTSLTETTEEPETSTTAITQPSGTPAKFEQGYEAWFNEMPSIGSANRNGIVVVNLLGGTKVVAASFTVNGQTLGATVRADSAIVTSFNSSALNKIDDQTYDGASLTFTIENGAGTQTAYVIDNVKFGVAV